jgi:hypothetical protein
MADEGWKQKVTWIAVGAVVSGVVGISITYLSGVLTPKPRLTLGISGPWPPNPRSPGSPDHISVEVHNSSSTIAKGVMVQVIARSSSVTSTNKQLFHMEINQLCKKLNDAEKFGFQYGTDQKNGNRESIAIHSVSASCDYINAGETRQVNVYFAAPVPETDDTPNRPERVEVYAGYEGYSVSEHFRTSDSPLCEVSRADSGRTPGTAEKCYYKEAS